MTVPPNPANVPGDTTRIEADEASLSADEKATGTAEAAEVAESSTLAKDTATLAADAAVPVVTPPVVTPPPTPTPGAPTPPTNLKVVVSGSSLLVTWANPPGTQGDSIYLDGGWIAGPGAGISPPTPVVQAYTVPSVAPGSHTVGVAAYNSSGQSAHAEVSVTVGSTPTPTPTPIPTPTPTPVPTSGKVQFWRYNNGTLSDAVMASDGVLVAGYSDYAYSANGRTANAYASTMASRAGKEQLIVAVCDLTAAEAGQVGQACVAGGQPDAFLRVMWEMNQHSWFPQWSQAAYPTAAEQAQAYMDAVDGLDATPGSNFSYIWNPNIDIDGSACLPGRTDFDMLDILVTHTRKNGKPYVQFVGIDGYDNNGAFVNDLVAWEAFIAKVKSYNLRWGANEWGIEGSDDPTYINGMFALFNGEEEGDVATFQGLFSLGGTSYDITKTPNSLAAFIAAAKGESGVAA